MKGFGLYIHSPFCRRKCVYCDFNSYAGMEALIDEYVAAVVRQIELTAASRPRPEVTTVYFGGGNPALLGVKSISKLLDVCRRAFTIAERAEVSIEMNPEDARRAILSSLKDVGFNRLSLGWQSLDNGRLKLLGRGHDAAQAVTSISEARVSGFNNVNIDLIFGLPGQSEQEWRDELAEASSRGPEHISTYALSIEPTTRLAQLIDTRQVEPPDEDAVARMYEMTRKELAASGYRQYEISNYALNRKECRHNLNYWAGGDYLGFGAGAHSHHHGRRWWSVDRPTEFIEGMAAGDAIGGRESLSQMARLGERIFLGLRLNQGVDTREIETEFGVDINEIYGNAIADLKCRGLLKVGRKMSLTAKGRLLANEAMSAFV